MTTWAQIINNTARDVTMGDGNGPFVVSGYNPNPGHTWVVVPDGTLSGATTSDGGTTFTNPAPAEPKPNNADNPYFPGWRPKTQLGFWGLVQRVFIALQGSNAAGAARFARLVNDTNASGIVKMIDATDLVDPDDKDGAFLSAVAFLISTNAASDSQPLMSAAEVTAIMQKANWA